MQSVDLMSFLCTLCTLYNDVCLNVCLNKQFLWYLILEMVHFQDFQDFQDSSEKLPNRLCDLG